MRRTVVTLAATSTALLSAAGTAAALPATGSDAGAVAGPVTGSSSGSSSGSARLSLPVPSAAGLTALAAASTQSGKPYLWGGTGPNAWDCSGLVQWAFHQAGVTLPRTTYQIARMGTPVAMSGLAPGDVIIFNADASHVGIYAGFGQVFNAFDYGTPIGLTPLSHWDRIYTIRRF